jgi:hypothetical protein
MTRRPCWLAGAVALTGLQITVPVDAQSLVEVARLAQVARSRTTGAVRTYTQEDFPPSDRLASRQRLRRATDERYRTRLAAALKRERHLERRLREARATRTPAGRRTRNVADEQARPDKAHGGGETGGGIPLESPTGARRARCSTSASRCDAPRPPIADATDAVGRDAGAPNLTPRQLRLTSAAAQSPRDQRRRGGRPRATDTRNRAAPCTMWHQGSRLRGSGLARRLADTDSRWETPTEGQSCRDR